MVRLLPTLNTTIIRILTLLLCLSPLAQANTQLNATVDRSKIYENDTLNLTVSGEIKMDFSFGGLMNFGRNQIQAPDMEALLKDFDILDQNQNYSMRSINGDSKAQVTWNYSIAPKRTGTLIIPAIEYQGATSNELRIEVLAGKAPRNADTPPLVFIEAEVDKQSAYVQEQVLYTLRLYSADHLATGDLSEPAPSDAIVESIGDTKKYYRMAYNQRYEVRERQYLLFPQKSGQLTIEAQDFNGMLINTRTRSRQRVRESSEPVTIEIKPPPANFSGDIWIPATSFELTERWDKEPYGLKVGDSVTRTIEVSALGLLGSALPPVAMKDMQGLKIYPDQPQVESFEHESGAQSTRKETSALVAISASEVTLPEIKIPWWDIVNDVERVAIIPARPFSIAPNPDQIQQVAQPSQLPQLSQTESAPASVETDSTYETETHNNQGPYTAPPVNNQPWYLIILLLIIGWVTTTWFLLKRQRTLVSQVPKEVQQLGTAYEEMIKAIKAGDNDMLKQILNWAKSHSNTINTIEDLKRLDERLYELMVQMERDLYAPNASGKSSIDKQALLKIVKRLNHHEGSAPKSSPLQPMYP